MNASEGENLVAMYHITFRPMCNAPTRFRWRLDSYGHCRCCRRSYLLTQHVPCHFPLSMFGLVPSRDTNTVLPSTSSLPCRRLTVLCRSHSPRGVFSCSIARQPRGANSANAGRHVFGKFSARCFQRRPFRHRHYSNYSNY